MNDSNPSVDFYFEKEEKWKAEIRLLREIVLKTGLMEELKWGVPCYVHGKSNVVLIHTFRDYCALLFVKGALLNDSEQILIQQTKNVQAARQMRFTSVDEISKLKKSITAYIFEAIENEKAGLQVDMKEAKEFEKVAEWQKAVDSDPKLKAAFSKLTPGRQRGYLLFFAGAKQSKTRMSRINKSIPAILEGKGLKD